MQLESRGAFDIPSFCNWASTAGLKVYEELKSDASRLTKVGRKTIITVDDARAWLGPPPKPSTRSRPEQPQMPAFAAKSADTE